MHKQKNTRRTAALALSFVMLLAPAAFGSSRTVRDPKDVPPRRIDIKAVSHSHHNGKLKHTVVAYERFTTARGPCVIFETNGGGKKDYRVCASTNMTNLREQQTTATVVMKRPNRRTIVYIFRKRAIGSPSRYGWFVKEYGLDRCRSCDRAPNSGLVRHDI